MGSKLGPTLPSKNPSLTLKTPELAHHAHQVLDLPLLAGANYVENRFGDVAGVDPFSVRERTDSSSPLSAPLSRHYSSQMRSAPLSVRCCLISALITTRRSPRGGRTDSASRMPEPLCLRGTRFRKIDADSRRMWALRAAAMNRCNRQETPDMLDPIGPTSVNVEELNLEGLVAASACGFLWLTCPCAS